MTDATAPTAPANEPRHFRRIIAIWLPLALAADLIWWFVAGPHMPPGDMTSAAQGAQFDFNILTIAALPVVLAVWTYYAYALITWRAGRGGPEPVGGPKARTNIVVSTAWIGTTAVIVLSAFVFGTVFLILPAGAGGGEGPQPIWTPTTKTVLPIQVIAQQWKFTYRYPTYGGFETDQLMLPDNTEIAFHVTSLDVIHDFWAYQLGVKADANPQVDNVAYTKTQALGKVTVRCDELCGLWHGAMFNYGKVVTKAAFQQWATSSETQLASATKLLPPFAWTYTPDANGADGSYYPDNVDPYSNVETYGANAVSVKTAESKSS